MWKLVKTIVKNMFIYPCGWARTMSCVVVHLQIYVHCRVNWLNIPSPSSTTTNLNHVTQWQWQWQRLLFTTRDTSHLAVQTATMTTTPMFQRLRKANDNDWRTGVEMRKEMEWNAVSCSQKHNDFLEKCSRFNLLHNNLRERKKIRGNHYNLMNMQYHALSYSNFQIRLHKLAFSN